MRAIINLFGGSAVRRKDKALQIFRSISKPGIKVSLVGEHFTSTDEATMIVQQYQNILRYCVSHEDLVIVVATPIVGLSSTNTRILATYLHDSLERYLDEVNLTFLLDYDIKDLVDYHEHVAHRETANGLIDNMQRVEEWEKTLDYFISYVNKNS